MAYRFKWGEPVPHAVRRIAVEEIESAESELSGKTESSRDEAVHEARKSIKKVRALLRLVRREFGACFDFENAALRKTSRKLSELRDQVAAIEIFDHLTARYPHKLSAKTADSVRQELLRLKRAQAHGGDMAKLLQKLAGQLQNAGSRVNRWPLETDGFAAIKDGLGSGFRKGRLAFERVQDSGQPEDYHEWRKRVKDHMYHMRLIEDLWNDMIKAREKSLHELETWLGDFQNLVVLREKIIAEPDSFATPKGVERLLDLIDEYQKELRDNSISLGERIYEQENRRQFVKRMKQIWISWEHQPDSLRKEHKREIKTNRKQAGPRKAARASHSR